MNEKTSSFQLLEPNSPEVLVPQSWLEPWMIVAAIVLLLALGAVIAFWKKKPATVDLLAVRNAAYREAASELEKITALQPREVAVQSSLILRKYLSTAAHDPALFETHEEFLSRHNSLASLTDEARAASEAGFSRLASLKYAAEPPNINPSAVVAESRTLLETLHHGFRA
jgi:hypothetical protein